MSNRKCYGWASRPLCSTHSPTRTTPSGPSPKNRSPKRYVYSATFHPLWKRCPWPFTSRRCGHLLFFRENQPKAQRTIQQVPLVAKEAKMAARWGGVADGSSGFYPLFSRKRTPKPTRRGHRFKRVGTDRYRTIGRCLRFLFDKPQLCQPNRHCLDTYFKLRGQFADKILVRGVYSRVNQPLLNSFFWH